MATFCSEACRDIGSTCDFCLHFKPTSIGSSDGICGITNQEALNILGRSGFTDQSKNGRGADVRLFGAVCDKASKMAEERRPSELVI